MQRVKKKSDSTENGTPIYRRLRRLSGTGITTAL